MHEWMIDNALTPHIVVDAKSAPLGLPQEQVKDDRIVLNVSYAATRGLAIGSEDVSFEARFNGVPRSLHIPIDAVLGIYARENGQGMVFSEEKGPEPPEPPSADDGDQKGSSRPALRVVK